MKIENISAVRTACTPASSQRRTRINSPGSWTSIVHQRALEAPSEGQNSGSERPNIEKHSVGGVGCGIRASPAARALGEHGGLSLLRRVPELCVTTRATRRHDGLQRSTRRPVNQRRRRHRRLMSNAALRLSHIVPTIRCSWLRLVAGGSACRPERNAKTRREVSGAALRLWLVNCALAGTRWWFQLLACG